MLLAKAHRLTLLLFFQLLVINTVANAQTSQWSPGPNMYSPASPLMTLLLDGRVLAAGGSPTAPATAQIFDPATNAWSVTGRMIFDDGNLASQCGPTYGGSATLLQNGLVLVAGGYNCSAGSISTAQLYDPKTGTWTATGKMATPRWGHSATLLANGKVLVAGGCCGPMQSSSSYPAGYYTSLTSAELYDPASGTWSSAGTLTTARYAHSATALNDGTVLIAGGVYYQTGVVASAETYDPATGTWRPTGSMATARGWQGSAKLLDGTVLVLGGSAGGCCSGLATAEVYDPLTKAWSGAGTMSTGRQAPSATVLSDGTVLAAGGYSCCSSPDSFKASTETYNARTKQWTGAGNMSAGREGHGAVRLSDGRVLIAGGLSQSNQVVATTDIFAGINTLPPQLNVVNLTLGTKQATPVTFSAAWLIAYDSDPDGDPLSVASVNSVSKSGGAIVDNGNGTYTYTPPAGFAGTDAFSYTITDRKDSTAIATVTVTVTAAPPPGPATYFPKSVSITAGSYDWGTMDSFRAEDNNTYDIRSVTAGSNLTDWYGTTNMQVSNPPATLSKLTVTYRGQYSRSNVQQQLYLYNFSSKNPDPSKNWDLFSTQAVGNSNDVTATAVSTNPQSYIDPVTGEMRARIRGASLSTSKFYCYSNFLSFQVQ